MEFVAGLNALRVLEKSYFWRDAHGQVIETGEKLFARVAHAVVQAENNWLQNADAIGKIEEDFFQAMCGGKFLPNSPALMNAGKQDG